MSNPIETLRNQTDSSKMEGEPAYDCEAGVPSGIASKGEQRDYDAHPVNPPAKKAPAKNLRKP